MNSIKEYIRDNDLIIDVLCKYRASVAAQMHKKELYLNLAKKGCDGTTILQSNSELSELFPPRKKWLRLSKVGRYSKEGQLLSTYDRNVARLKLTLKYYYTKSPSEPFVVKLNDFILSVKDAFSNPKYKIERPVTLALKKNPNDKNDLEYRPISKYEKLIDAVVIKIANKYLTKLFDPLFCHEGSLAFRARRPYKDLGEIFTTHHHAAACINEYRKKYNSHNIYVSECDISKFYDSVDHKVVRDQFNSFISKAKKHNPKLQTRDITRIFNSYLESFSFARDVFSKNKDQKYWDNQGVTKGCFNWIDKDLISQKYYTNRNIRFAKIGVPQGGALSGLIANMVLDVADMQIKHLLSDRMLYIRYCDDMLLLSTNKRIANKAIVAYFNTLTQLRLIPHKPITPDYHNADFWKAKSKNVYLWKVSSESAPWIGFVGYEFRRTGEVRIRKKSLDKELNKQKEVYNMVQKFARMGDKSKGTILESLAGRLIGMSVGRVSIWNYESFKNELCWIDGFNKLSINKYSSAQIKLLDRNRSKILYLAEKKITSKKNPEPLVDVEKRYIPQYYGVPYSYHFHYRKK